MESITKNRQSTATLRAMIDRAYGTDAVPAGDDFAVELAHGWFNVVYRLTLRDGRDVVVKIAPPADVEVMTYEYAMMRNELAAIALVEAHTDVPVPRVDFVDTSHELIDADWFAMAYVDADNIGVAEKEGRYSAAELDSYNEQLGALNAQLNTIVGPHFGPLDGPGSSTWREAFGAMFSQLLDDGERAGVDLGFATEEFRAVFDEAADDLDQVTEPRFVEWDLWLLNALGGDGRIVALIDHERALYGDPLIEAGFLTAGMPELGDPEPFLRGYGRGPLTDAEQPRRRLYSLYLFLVMTIETTYRGHEDPGQYEVAKAMVELVMAQFGRTPPPAG